MPVEINGQLYVQEGDGFRRATPQEEAAAQNNTDTPTTLLAAAERDTTTPDEGGGQETSENGAGFLLNDDGVPARAAVRFQTGTDDDNNPTYETRLGRYRVDASGSLSIEFPQRPQEGGNE